VVVEIGVLEGGSLLMWKDYFGGKAKIYGIDWNPDCTNKVKADGVEVVIGSQSDREFLRRLKVKIPKMDILIDDGGHMMEQQIVTFEELFSHVSDDGVYLCEDLHTSYWEEFGGGYRKSTSFVEYSKNFIDMLNAYHSRTPELAASEFTKTVNSVHYYDSIIVVEKEKRQPPEVLMTGIRYD
jgi:hypothetical protein